MMEHHEVQDLLGAAVLGAVSGAELRAVQAHLAVCDECHEAVRRLGGVATVLPLTVPEITPPPALRGRILAAVGQEEHMEGRSVERTDAAAASRPLPPEERPELPRTRVPLWSRFLPYGMATAAAVLALVVGGWGMSVQGRLAQVERELEQSQTQPAGNLLIASLRSPGTLPSARGNLVYLKQEKAAMLMAENLPPPRDKVYRVWVQIGGQVRLAGALTVYPDGRGVIYMPGDMSNVQAVIVSLDPEPLSPSPTGDIVLETRL